MSQLKNKKSIRALRVKCNLIGLENISAKPYDHVMIPLWGADDSTHAELFSDAVQSHRAFPKS